jgi:3',5'-cyclic-AMP phosphodiesterase
MRIAWLTDIHLNFVRPKDRQGLYAVIRATEADALMVTGDWDEAPTLLSTLREWDAALPMPTYFVLGNHDYYHGSFEDTQSRLRQYLEGADSLTWLTQSGVVSLTSDVALIGHDGWADARCGDFFNSSVQIADHILIRELKHLPQHTLYQRLTSLGDAAAQDLEDKLRLALQKHTKVLLATHVPPYREACWHEGKISDDNWLPHFSCRAVGERLTAVMEEHPQAQLHVYCGHTHGEGFVQIRPNLAVHTGGAEYCYPRVHSVIEV